MGDIKSYKDLDVWKKAVELAKEVYLLTKNFPRDELYGIVNQIRRSSVSIASNIAEGKSRQHKNEYIQFLYIALGSCAELETQVIISKELGYLDDHSDDVIFEDLDHLGRMIRNLIKSLKLITDNREPRT
ncbi:MAG: four helix bundle protein [Candidatus Omnitrophica bacterium]|nr:four helix bundle protein [Candidatus Omnitrophota bacterium]